MTRLHWVRHGPTHQKAFTGWRDVPADLTDLAHVARVNAALPRDGLVVSSDLLRARQTADALAGGREILPSERSLREFDFGDWDGLHFSEVAERDPELSRRYWEEPGDLAPPGGESWNAVARRVSDAVDTLCAAHPDRDLILVAHFGVILVAIARAAACPAVDALGHTIDPLSITRMSRDGDGWSLEAINHHP